MAATTDEKAGEATPLQKDVNAVINAISGKTVKDARNILEVALERVQLQAIVQAAPEIYEKAD